MGETISFVIFFTAIAAVIASFVLVERKLLDAIRLAKSLGRELGVSKKRLM
jgi:hypothetical protein